MGQTENINWFPGHMAKAIRNIKENIRIADIVIEVADARIPISSRNSDIQKIIGEKPILLVLNKSDLADSKQTEKWITHYTQKGINTISMECKSGKGIGLLKKKINHLMGKKCEKWQLKGISRKTIKAIILGEPNTGKSSLINRLATSYKVKAENRPGVTKKNIWIPIDETIDVLDTPGILPPKIQEVISQNNLAFTGAIKDEVLDLESVSLKLISFLIENYLEMLKNRYKINDEEINNAVPYEILILIGKKRRLLTLGGEVDTQRTSIMLLSEFREGKIGKITLEKVKV